MRAALYIFILLVSCNILIAQNQRIDSLKNVIASSLMEEDSSTVNTLNQISDAYSRISQFDSSLHYAKKASVLADSTHHTVGKISSLNMIGVTNWYLGNFSRSMEALFYALELAEKIGNKKAIANSLNNIGIVYASENEYEKAEEYYTRTLKLKKDLKDKKGISGTLVNLGSLAEYRKDFQKALDYYKQSLVIKEDLKDKKGIGICLNNIGSVLFSISKDNYKEAIDYLERALIIREELGDKSGLASTYNHLGLIYIAKEQYSLAERHLLKSKNVLVGINNLVLIQQNESLLAEIYKKTNRYKEAYNSIIESYKAQDSLKSANTRAKTEQIELKHEFEKEKLEIRKAQEIRNEIVKADKNKQKIILFGVSVGLILAVILAIFILKRYQIIKHQKIVIEKQKILVDDKSKEITDSIHYAKRIQDSLFEEFDSGNKFFTDTFIFLKPKDIVSGDFYWHAKKMNTEKISNNELVVKEHFFVAICDSTGHGVPGGFMSLLNMAYLSEAINEKNILEPSKVFDYVRDRLINSMSKNQQKDGFDGVLLKFEKSTTFVNKEITKTELKLFYAAAHNAPLLVRNGSLIELETEKMPVGYGERRDKFNLHSFNIQSNDILYIYTDGYADQFGGSKGKKLMYKKLNELILQISNKPLENQKEDLNKQFEEWRGDLEQVDDVLIIGIKV